MNTSTQTIAARAGLDPVQLHAQALNSLSHCMRELRSEGTDYDRIARYLARANEALGTLAIIDAHGLCKPVSV